MPTVRDEEMLAYVSHFHEVYRATANWLPRDLRSQLPRYPYLDRKIRVLISTTHGAGFEYLEESGSEVEIYKGSRRIEDLFFDPPPAFRVSTMPRRASVAVRLENSKRATFTRCGYKNIIPLELRSPSDVTLIDTSASAEGWERHVVFAELHSDNTTGYWSKDNASSRAKEEILLALVHAHEVNRGAPPDFSDFIEDAKKRYLLLLGDFSPDGRTRLDAIRRELPERYESIMLDEIEEIPEYDLLQKAQAVAGICRVTIVDDSSKAGQLAEIAGLLPQRVVMLVLRLEGSQSSNVSNGLSVGSGGRIQEISYTFTSLSSALATGMTKAEEFIREVGEQLAEVYKWRSPPGTV